MRLTMRSDYGAHAVIELARRYGQGPVQCAEIAASQKIPVAYLDQLLSGLRRVGIVRSVRWPIGPTSGRMMWRAYRRAWSSVRAPLTVPFVDPLLGVTKCSSEEVSWVVCLW